MLRRTPVLAALVWLAAPGMAAYAQDQSQDQSQVPVSLGDLARQARKDKEKNAAKSKTVITDETLPSSKGLDAFGDGSRAVEGSAAMSEALSKLQEAESSLNKLDTLDRATLAKAVLMDNDVDFPNRRDWEARLYSEKQHYVSHERELIAEIKEAMAQVDSMRPAQGGQKPDPNDPRVQTLKSRLAEIIQDVLRTEQGYRTVVMEGWDLAKQAKH